MEIFVIGGIVVLIVLMFIVRSMMTSRERQISTTPSPQELPSLYRRSTGPARIPSAFSGTVPGGETVSILSVGPKKIEVIKVIRSYTNLGLAEAKNLADAGAHAPVLVAKDLNPVVANDFRRDLELAGATADTSPGQMAEPELMQEGMVTFEIEWIDVGPRKINVIKIIRQYTSLGLAEAKNATEVPSFSVTMSANQATQFLTDLRSAGATANVHGI